MRLFVGVAVNDNLRRGLAAALSAWQTMGPDLRWVRPELFHLTLQFIGESSDTETGSLADVLATVSRAPFTLAPAALLTLPQGAGIGRAHVLALDFSEGVGELGDLAARVTAATGRLGLMAEKRPFRAHLTLARVPRGGSIPEALAPERLQSPPLPAWSVEEFHLYRSRLGSGGADYEILRSYRLKGGKDARV